MVEMSDSQQQHERLLYRRVVFPDDLNDHTPAIPRTFTRDFSHQGRPNYPVKEYDDYVDDCNKLTQNLCIDGARATALYKAIVDGKNTQPLVILEHAAGAGVSLPCYSAIQKQQGGKVVFDTLMIADASPDAINSTIKKLDAIPNNKASGETKFVFSKRYVDSFIDIAYETVDDIDNWFENPVALDNKGKSYVYGKKYLFTDLPEGVNDIPKDTTIWVICGLPEDSQFLTDIVDVKRIDFVIDLLSVCSTNNPIGYLYQLTHLFKAHAQNTTFQSKAPNPKNIIDGYKIVLFEHGLSPKCPYTTQDHYGQVVDFVQHRISLACCSTLNFDVIYNDLIKNKWVGGNNVINIAADQLMANVWDLTFNNTAHSVLDGQFDVFPEKVPHFRYFQGEIQ